jgi:hypothetical protein
LGAQQPMASPSTTFASLASIQRVAVSGFESWRALLAFHLASAGAWGETERALAATLAGALAAFALLFAALSFSAGESEVRLARRSALAAQLALALLLLRHAAQAALDLLLLSRRAPPRNELQVAWPDFAVARPAAGALLALLGLLLTTHHAFRWLLVAAQPLMLALEMVNAAALQQQADCLRAASCTQAVTGLSLDELVWAVRLHYAGAALAVWAGLSACVALSIVGAAGPRFPVRLFDTSASLESITHHARDVVARNREAARLAAEVAVDAEISELLAAGADEAAGGDGGTAGLAGPAGSNAAAARSRSHLAPDATPRAVAARSMKEHRDAAKVMRQRGSVHARARVEKIPIVSRAAGVVRNIFKVANDNIIGIVTSTLSGQR